MTPEEATKELYRTIWRYEENTKVEDVERLLKNGAQLTGIISPTFGLPIIMAIDNRCDLRIIELLAKHGGADMNYKIPYESFVTTFIESRNYGVYKRIVAYNSIINSLIRSYYLSIGNSKFENCMFELLYKQNYIDEHIIVQNNNPCYKGLYKYIHICCKILNIEISTLETIPFDIPPDLKDFQSIPRDDPPYYWIYNRPLFSDEKSEDYIECDCNGGESDDCEHSGCECGTSEQKEQSDCEENSK
jgi:hypothetical protein